MRGRAVTVMRKAATYDEDMDLVETWETEAVVDNVLVSWGAGSALSGDEHADGAAADVTISIPRGCPLTDLTGRRVLLPAPWDSEGGYEVVGLARPTCDPSAVPMRNPWYWSVHLRAVSG